MQIHEESVHTNHLLQPRLETVINHAHEKSTPCSVKFKNRFLKQEFLVTLICSNR